MLSTISRVYNSTSNDFGFNFGSKDQTTLPVFEKIDKHLSVLHYRNSQLRNAILANSEDYVSKRKDQFITVLKSYVHLIITELHQPIVDGNKFGKNSRYSQIRAETFSGYEALLKKINLPASEMLKLGSEFARELFDMERQIREYQVTEEEFIYPLYTLAIDNSRSRGLLRRVHN